MDFIVEEKKDIPQIIEGGLACDERGTLSFVNDFAFREVKRFYQIENMSKDTIRAFHGHNREAKFVYVPKGIFMVGIFKINSAALLTQEKRQIDEGLKTKQHMVSEPLYLSENEVEAQKYILSSKKPKILYIPAGYANGMRAMEEGSIILFFSTSNMAEARKDDIRFDWDILGPEFWEAKNW